MRAITSKLLITSFMISSLAAEEAQVLRMNCGGGTPPDGERQNVLILDNKQ